MEEVVVSKEELIEKFESQEIVDTGKGWMMGEIEIEIIALHDVDPKFLQDITNAKFYKLIPKRGNR
jgi:hypothetical protein